MYSHSARVSNRQAYLQSFGRSTKIENQQLKKYPTAISSRASTKFVREELEDTEGVEFVPVGIKRDISVTMLKLMGLFLLTERNQSSQLIHMLTMNLLRWKKRNACNNNKNNGLQTRETKRKWRKHQQQQPRHYPLIQGQEK